MKVLQVFLVLNLVLWMVSFFGMMSAWGTGSKVVANSLPHLAANVFLGGLIFTSLNLLICGVVAILLSKKNCI